MTPRRRLSMRLRRTLHRLTDPARSLPNHRQAARSLSRLPDGQYSVHDAGVTVPYVSQFASPDLIGAYIHGGLHGRDDPNWTAFGAGDPDLYTFWAHRACAIACIKMAADAFGTAPACSMWQLVEEGLALGGYRTHDARGVFVDEGWFHPALVKLAERHGLQVGGMAYASTLNMCAAIRDGDLVAAAVTPELGESGRSGKSGKSGESGRFRQYDGHFVLVYGFTWQAGRCASLTLHNPSGRCAELQANAVIPAARFRAAFAHRFMTFRPAGQPEYPAHLRGR